jgi:membrane-bound serine protease (ClpP class)
MGGMLGLFIEITHPGAVFPGVFGGLCLLLGLYAMSVLPTDVTGLLLLAFSLLLFLLEVKIVSYGLLSVAGAVAMFVGSLLLFRDDYGTLSIPMSFIVVPVASVSAAAAGLVLLVVRARRNERRFGLDALVGEEGEVRDWDGGHGTIFIRGEIWAAKGATANFSLERGMRVRVVSASGLTLEIEPLGS